MANKESACRLTSSNDLIPDPFSGDMGCPPYTDDQREFMVAIEKYKADHKRRFPSCSEVLAVLRSLGYRKVAEPTEVPRYGTGRKL